MSFNYGGRAFDPGLAPAQMEQMVYAYANISTLGGIITDSTQQWLIKLKDKDLKAEALRSISNDLSLTINKTAKVVGLVIPPPGEHPHCLF
jgi:hypothetical protein